MAAALPTTAISGRNAKLGDVLDTARRNAELVLADDPATLAATELTLAKAYDTLGDLDNALQSANLALAVAQARGGCLRWHSTPKSRCPMS